MFIDFAVFAHMEVDTFRRFPSFGFISSVMLQNKAVTDLFPI